jgi:hypothetical protein
MHYEIAKHNLKPGDILYHIENNVVMHKIILQKEHFECNHKYLNRPNQVIFAYTINPTEPVTELDNHSILLSAAIQKNGEVIYIPITSHTYLDKDIAEKVAAQIKDVYKKLKFAKIYKKLVFMHPRSHRYMTILDVDSKSIKEKIETWQKQYAYEEIPFKMFFVNDYGEVYRYDELLNDFIEYQKALELKDKLEIDF